MSDSSRYVHYGAHITGPPTWRNFDSSPTLRIQRLPVIGVALHRRLPGERPFFPPTVEYGDIVRGLPVSERHCRAVYCSHVLEHLALNECRTALAHTFAYLAPGGLFRLVMPDLRALAAAYLEYDGPEAAHLFMQRAWLGQTTRSTSLSQKVTASFGGAAHLWMWDYDSMAAELDRQGFTDIRRAEFGDSEEPRFADVETPSRFQEEGFDGTGVLQCLAIECRRPA